MNILSILCSDLLFAHKVAIVKEIAILITP